MLLIIIYILLTHTIIIIIIDITIVVVVVVIVTGKRVHNISRVDKLNDHLQFWRLVTSKSSMHIYLCRT